MTGKFIRDYLRDDKNSEVFTMAFLSKEWTRKHQKNSTSCVIMFVHWKMLITSISRSNFDSNHNSLEDNCLYLELARFLKNIPKTRKGMHQHFKQVMFWSFYPCIFFNKSFRIGFATKHTLKLQTRLCVKFGFFSRSIVHVTVGVHVYLHVYCFWISSYVMGVKEAVSNFDKFLVGKISKDTCFILQNMQFKYFWKYKHDE